MPELDEGAVTRTKIANTIRTVSRWRDVAEIYGTAGNIDMADGMIAEVERLLHEGGVRAMGKTLADVPPRRSK